MNFRVGVAHEAGKILDRLDRPTEQRVRARFVQLAVDPFDPRLSGESVRGRLALGLLQGAADTRMSTDEILALTRGKTNPTTRRK